MISSSLDTLICYINTPWNFARNNSTRSSPPEVFLSKGNLKICRKFTGEPPCQSVISVKLLCTLVWMLFCKFYACFQNMFSSEQHWTAVSGEFFNIRVLHIPQTCVAKRMEFYCFKFEKSITFLRTYPRINSIGSLNMGKTFKMCLLV